MYAGSEADITVAWPIISKGARRPNKSMTSGKPKPKAYKGGNEWQEEQNVELAPSPPASNFPRLGNGAYEQACQSP
jgi:hypothetical protein